MVIEINYCHSFCGDQNQSPPLIWWWVKAIFTIGWENSSTIGWGIFAIGWRSKMISIIWCELKGNFTIGWMGDQKVSSSSIVRWNKIIVQFFSSKESKISLAKRWGSSLVSNNMSTRERKKERRLVYSLRQSNQINNILKKLKIK